MVKVIVAFAAPREKRVSSGVRRCMT